MVAKRVRDSLPLKLSANWEVLKEISLNTAGSLNSDDTAFVSVDEDLRPSVDVDETEKNPEILQTLRESFLKAFKVMDRELRTTPSIDCFCSGTTAVTLIKQGRDLFIGNVGDSRAVLCTRDRDDTLSAIQLTVDLKPSLPAEAERIRKCRGRVFALQDEPEVARVWLPNNDSPGLAMARAFGDFCLKDFGLISVPDVSYRRLTEKDEFIVLATDGIWDVLSNKEVVDVIATAPARPSAAQALVETAVRVWRQKYPTSKVDDCAVVCLFLDLDSNIESTAANNGSNEKEQPTTADEVNAEEDLSETASLVRAGTVRTAEEILADEEEDEEDEEEDEEDEEGGGRKENAAEEMNSEPGVEWSALEGVSRVNTLLNLPRFTPTKEDEKMWKKV
ncbi:protein phosphatase 2C 33 [Pyrus ussuriensis x Pyrus communis]|uniref:Protein phosphatase 2C 33 n=2 Tax=Pyrus TaxID=3766 RepID=A0A5N5I313_9ROSA|nr:protein phosphatase 2C 33 [Pyrus ussuriensis x Pyrus communis]